MQPPSVNQLLAQSSMAYESPTPVDSAGSSPSIGVGWRTGADYKAYWQDRLNITDEMYTYERDLVLKRIREKWQYGAWLPSDQVGRDELAKWLQPTLSKFGNIRPHFSKVRGFNNEGEALLSLYTNFAFFVHQHYRHTSRGRKRARDHHDPDVEKRQRTGGQEDVPTPKLTRLRSSAGTSNDAARRFFKGIDSAIRSSALSRSTPQRSRMTTNPTSASSETKVADGSTPVKTEPQVKDAAQPSLELRPSTEPPLQPAAPPPSPRHMNQQFSWTNVEVRIDTTVLQAGTIWMTMLDLMHDNLTLCHWNQFKLETLHRQ